MSEVKKTRRSCRSGVDAMGNERFKVYFKSGTSSMLFCDGVTKPAADSMIKRLLEHMTKLGTVPKGKFIITH